MEETYKSKYGERKRYFVPPEKQGRMKYRTGDIVYIKKILNMNDETLKWSARWILDRYPRINTIVGKTKALIIERYYTCNDGYKNYHLRVKILEGVYQGKIYSIGI